MTAHACTAAAATARAAASCGPTGRRRAASPSPSSSPPSPSSVSSSAPCSLAAVLHYSAVGSGSIPDSALRARRHASSAGRAPLLSCSMTARAPCTERW
eukprot:6629550-Prymnesium_polylepis.1